jgi:hypothetical protein
MGAMITGRINADGLPLIDWMIGPKTWPAIIDTGFNGELDLCNQHWGLVKATYSGIQYSFLPTGQAIQQDEYIIEVLFDGQIRSPKATFSRSTDILIGTGFLKDYRLEINFAAGTVLLERVAP